MKKNVFFIILIILGGGEVFGQEEKIDMRDYFSFSPEISSGDYSGDTMTIEEIVLVNQETKGDTSYHPGAELILSKTPIDSELNYGILWQEGIIIPLPRESVPQTVVIRKSGGKYILIWFHSEPDGSFTRRSTITALQDTTGLSGYLTVKPMLTRRNFKSP
jgi:hypothetical protein